MSEVAKNLAKNKEKDEEKCPIMYTFLLLAGAMLGVISYRLYSLIQKNQEIRGANINDLLILKDGKIGILKAFYRGHNPGSDDPVVYEVKALNSGVIYTTSPENVDHVIPKQTIERKKKQNSWLVAKLNCEKSSYSPIAVFDTQKDAIYYRNALFKDSEKCSGGSIFLIDEILKNPPYEPPTHYKFSVYTKDNQISEDTLEVSPAYDGSYKEESDIWWAEDHKLILGSIYTVPTETKESIRKRIISLVKKKINKG